MEFDLSKINFSNNDLKRNICIPKKLTPKLAEFIGIVVGDGHIGYYKYVKNNRSRTNYELRISGNVKDSDYYLTHVNNLAYELFNMRFYKINPKNEESVMLYKNSKAIYYFFSECLKIPQRKDTISIPSCILEAPNDVKSSFLRGLADADFTLTIKKKEGKPYPFIQGVSKSKILINQVSLILKEWGINHTTFLDKYFYEKRNISYEVKRININGVNNIKGWFNKIGFSNTRHRKTWEEFLKKSAPVRI